MKFKLIILLSIVMVTIGSCKSESQIEEEIKIKLSELIKAKLDSSNFSEQADNLLYSNDVQNFYNQSDFEAIWINDSSINQSGLEFLDFIKSVKNYGLIPEFYNYSKIISTEKTDLFECELLLTSSFFKLGTHLNVGFIDKDSIRINWRKDSTTVNLTELLIEVKEGEDIVEILKSVQPKNWEYVQLQKGLEVFLSTIIIDSSTFVIPKYKEDSTACYEATKKAFIVQNYLTQEEGENDSIFKMKLKSFQAMHGLEADGVIGKWTGRMIEQNSLEKFYEAAISLEKWRWQVYDSIPERRIWVNIPAYTLKIYEKDNLVRKHRVVVGSYLTQTPEFHASLKRMVTNPFWYVPYSISSTEILNNIKSDSTSTEYLTKRGYKLFRDGAEVDAGTVDWTEVVETNFRYNVRQDGGGGNSLGKIKFLFPNKHAVFIHDTPSKSLFWNDVRAYSHGCVRLHQPYELAKAIVDLDDNKVISDSIVPMIKRGAKKIIELNTPIEVYIEYFTVVGDSLGQIKFFPDIYNRNDTLVNLFKQN